MIRTISIFVVACALLFPHQAAATPQSDLRKLGMKKLTESEEAQSKAGKIQSGASYSENGDLVAVFWINYKRTSNKRGDKILRVRRPAGGTPTNVTLKWRIRGKRFCEEQFSENGREVCKQKTFRLGSTCYIFHKNGNINFMHGCAVPE